MLKEKELLFSYIFLFYFFAFAHLFKNWNSIYNATENVYKSEMS